jgi:hypothetical protein
MSGAGTAIRTSPVVGSPTKMSPSLAHVIRPLWAGLLDLDRPPTSATREVETRIDGKAMEPGIEPVRIAKSRQVSPGANEPLLDRVARELGVPENQAGRRVQPRERRVDERGEGVMIAMPCAFDERSLVHDGPRFTAT